MRSVIKTLAIVAALGAGSSAPALAQYACPVGYVYYNGVCQPSGYYAPNPVGGAAAGGAAGAAAGGAAAGPVGAIVGGAIGTATGAAAGAVGAPVAPGYACAPGYYYYNGGCYPR